MDQNALVLVLLLRLGICTDQLDVSYSGLHDGPRLAC